MEIKTYDDFVSYAKKAIEENDPKSPYMTWWIGNGIQFFRNCSDPDISRDCGNKFGEIVRTLPFKDEIDWIIEYFKMKGKIE